MSIAAKGRPGILARALGAVVFKVDEELGRTPPGCIAVLPFETVADVDDDLAGHAEQVRRAIYAQLAPPGGPRHRARTDRPNASHALARGAEEPCPGRPALGRGALLIGTVTEYRQHYLGLYSDVAVGAQIELLAAADGARLWEARHVAISRGGGLPISPLAVIEGAVSAVTNLAGEQFDRITDDLARRLVSTLPAPALT